MIDSCPECDAVMSGQDCACGYSRKAARNRIWQPSTEPVTPKEEALKRIAKLRQEMPYLRRCAE